MAEVCRTQLGGSCSVKSDMAGGCSTLGFWTTKFGSWARSASLLSSLYAASSSSVSGRRWQVYLRESRVDTFVQINYGWSNCEWGERYEGMIFDLFATETIVTTAFCFDDLVENWPIVFKDAELQTAWSVGGATWNHAEMKMTERKKALIKWIPVRRWP